MPELVADIATSPEDFRQIRGLNYRTFVEEIPQHSPNDDAQLTDRFEAESTFLVCRCGDRIVGMTAVRARRPFSLDAKLEDLDGYLPEHRSVCEVRLLAVEPERRSGRIMGILFDELVQFCLMRGHDLAVISGTVRQVKLYRHMGFKPFGPLVGSVEARYQPMYLHVADLIAASSRSRSAFLGSTIARRINVLPGPVDLHPNVEAALAAESISHRSSRFAALLRHTRHMLCKLANADDVVIANGSGTLANDMVAGQIQQLGGRGLILSNGEFGERLIDHARRFRLPHVALRTEWGRPFAIAAVEKALSETSYNWLWMVHAETSTGVLNDLGVFKELSRRYDMKLCVDCVSSLGVVPCNLDGIFFAASASGKGLRSLAGLAIVFHPHKLPPQTVPLARSLDLSEYAKHGVPYTLPSRLVAALHTSLEQLIAGEHYANLQKAAADLRSRLREHGMRVLGEEQQTFPGAITIALPGNVDSVAVGEEMERRGWLLSYRSSYLRHRNWIQISLVRERDTTELALLSRLLVDAVTATANTAT